MKTLYVAAILFFSFTACKRETNTELIPSPVLLLTDKQWILSGHGFDSDKNGRLDEFENIIRDCEKDNSYIFTPQGTGKYFDNSNTCGAGMSDDFNWKFADNFSILEIDFEKLKILKLTATEMILQPQIPAVTETFLLIYKH
jgi:Lipocalin-like domain